MGVPLRPGERYVVYLTGGGGCRVSCRGSRERRGGEGAEIVTGSGDRVLNDMVSFEVYGSSSGWYSSVAAFTAPADPPERLVLRFRDVVAMGLVLSRQWDSSERYLFTIDLEDLLSGDPNTTGFEVRLDAAAAILIQPRAPDPAPTPRPTPTPNFERLLQDALVASFQLGRSADGEGYVYLSSSGLVCEIAALLTSQEAIGKSYGYSPASERVAVNRGRAIAFEVKEGPDAAACTAAIAARLDRFP